MKRQRLECIEKTVLGRTDTAVGRLVDDRLNLGKDSLLGLCVIQCIGGGPNLLIQKLIPDALNPGNVGSGAD